MGEYEPNDSRNVTLNPGAAPGEPPRTGPRENETREQGAPERDRAAADKDATVRQQNNAQEVTGGDLPDPDRAENFDQDEG